jgi:hypothetical protein
MAMAARRFGSRDVSSLACGFLVDSSIIELNY